MSKKTLEDRFYSGGMSLKFQVARQMIQVEKESNNLGFCLVLFFLYSLQKWAGVMFIVALENPQPPALNDSPVCY